MAALVIYLIALPKGGPGKTTTAAFVAFCLARLGFTVGTVDADTKTQGLTDWITMAKAAGLHVPFPHVQWDYSTGMLIDVAYAHAERHGLNRLILDTGGEDPNTIKQASRFSTHMVMPLAPTTAETRRVAAAAHLVAENTDLYTSILFTRVKSPKYATSYREQLVGHGFSVLDAEIPHKERLYADAWGTVPTDLGAYEQATKELEASRG